MNSTPVFDQLNDFQQTFLVSVGSNLIPQITGTASSLQDAQSQAIQQMENEGQTSATVLITAMNAQLTATANPDQWAIVSPLQVYVDTDRDLQFDASSGEFTANPTNAYYVAARKDGNGQITDYVIGVAGTNPKSMFAILDEDADVLTLKPWPYFDQDKKKSKHIKDENEVKVSGGTLRALDILTNEMGVSLIDFLAGIQESNINVTFTGHSLGGALAPALALEIMAPITNVGGKVVQQALANNWTTRIMPTAPPDIGNQAYVNALNDLFPPGTGTTPFIWNQKIWNSIDMVPQVWSDGAAAAIDHLYGSELATPKYIQCTIDGLMAIIKTANPNDNYAPLDPEKVGQFAGVFEPVANITGYDCQNCDGDHNTAPKDVCDFFAEALYQHMTGYFIGFKITNYAEYLPLPSPCAGASKLYKADSPCAE